jgi:integrase
MRDLRHETARAAGSLDDYLARLDLQGKSVKTIYGYGRAIAPLLRSHPDKTVAEFTAADIEHELRLVPPRSRHISRSIYNGWFKWAEAQELLDRNPMGKVATFKEPKRRPSEIFTDAERYALEALPTPDGELWAVLFGTGIRAGIAMRLKREHIDLDRAILHCLNDKGGKDHDVAMPGSLVSRIADLDLFERLQPTDHLWYTKRPRGIERLRRDAIGRSTFARWYRAGIEAADVRYLNPHQTRHTFGWWLRTQGLALDDRKLQMGHEDIRTTDKYYGHGRIEDLAEVMAAL